MISDEGGGSTMVRWLSLAAARSSYSTLEKDRLISSISVIVVFRS